MKNIGLPRGVVYACLAETIVLALEGRFENFTVGRAHRVAEGARDLRAGPEARHEAGGHLRRERRLQRRGHRARARTGAEGTGEAGAGPARGNGRVCEDSARATQKERGRDASPSRSPGPGCSETACPAAARGGSGRGLSLRAAAPPVCDDAAVGVALFVQRSLWPGLQLVELLQTGRSPAPAVGHWIAIHNGHQLTVATGSCLVSRLAAGIRISLSVPPTAKPWHQTRDSDSLCRPTQGCQGRIRTAPSTPGGTRRSPASRRLLGVVSEVHEPLQSRAAQCEQHSVGPRAETSAQRTRAEPRRRSQGKTPRGTDPPA